MEGTYLQTMENKTLHESNEQYDIEIQKEFPDEVKDIKEEETKCVTGQTTLRAEGAVPDVSTQVMNVNNILMCNPCLYDDTEEEAVGFCVTCVEHLCQGCCRDHKRSKVTRYHKIVKDNLPEDVSIFRLMKEMTSCSEHPDTQVSHKCEDHNAFVCAMCIAGGHRKCEHVTELQKERNDSDISVREAVEKLDAIQEKSRLIVKTRNENMETLIKEKDDIKKSNAALLHDVYNNLLLFEQDTIIKSENVTQSEMSHLRKDIDICKELEKEILMFEQLLDTAKLHYSTTEVIIITDAIRDKIFSLNSILDKQQQKGEIHLLFKQNPLLYGIKSLGHLKLCRGDTLLEDTAQGIGGSSDKKVHQFDLPLASPEQKVTCRNDGAKGSQKTNGVQKPRKNNEKVKKYSVRISGDVSDCCISGIVILQDGIVVVTDQANRKVKVFSSGDCRQICAYSLEAQPVDICKVGPKNFAVVYKDMKLIDRYTIDGETLKLERSWKTKYLNVGITMDRELYWFYVEKKATKRTTFAYRLDETTVRFC